MFFKVLTISGTTALNVVIENFLKLQVPLKL